jgi:hypothetical protein
MPETVNPKYAQSKFKGGKPATQGEATAVAALRSQFEKARRAYPYFLPFSFAFDGSTKQVSQSLKVSAYGDFLCSTMAGTVRGSGGTVPAGSVSGILMKMRETGFNREFQQDWIPLDSILTPGPGTTLYRPIAWETVFLSKSTIEIDLMDTRDGTGNPALNVYILLKGQQYSGSFGNL